MPIAAVPVHDVAPAGSFRLAGVSKRYALERQVSVLGGLRRPRGERWALRDVDLVIDPGEAVGILGHNGAGKTTLLRLLAGVTRPTEGTVRRGGRVAPLISVGVGFHQELSGRENVHLNGRLLGLSRRQLAQLLPSIVEFSELDAQVLDRPVKLYSSGMLLRLAFSIVIHVEPEAMVVDEILAVGDVAFQAKCLARLRAMWAGGTTLALVSHSPNVVRTLCPRTIVLHRGRVAFDGGTEQAIWVHNDLLGRDDDPEPSPLAELSHTELTGAADLRATTLEPGQRYRLRHEVRFLAAVASPQVYFHVFDESGEVVYQSFSTVGRTHDAFGPGDRSCVEIDFTAGMGPGRYRLATELRSLDGRRVLCRDGAGITVSRTGGPSEGAAELAASIVVGGTTHELTGTDARS